MDAVRATITDRSSRADLELLRVAAVTPLVTVADPDANAAATVALLERLASERVALAVFPEAGLTGYTCEDLFGSPTLRAAALRALDVVADATERTGVAAIVGLPVEIDGRLYNCAAVVADGDVVGLVPKRHLAERAEFYDARWFTAGDALDRDAVRLGQRTVPVGTDLLFEVAGLPGAILGVEICEDLWTVQPPSGDLALAGATVIANLSASDELVGKDAYRRDLVTAASGRLLAGYIYAAAGPGESTKDLVFSGHSMIAENATPLGETERFSFEPRWAIADLDLARLRTERLRSGSFATMRPSRPHRRVPVRLPLVHALADAPRRPLSATPFLPPAGPARDIACAEVAAIASTGLARRLRHLGSGRVVIGVSGGLDSTLALLFIRDAFERLGLPASDIHAVSMPGPGTTERTRANAAALAAAVGATFHEIPITDAVMRHLADIGHDGSPDLTFENAQAQERTLVLFSLGRRLGAFVVGTGDLSELALGWMTYGGDHLSMYHVNAGIPKTLVGAVVEWEARTRATEALAAVLADVLHTPISPELLPTDGTAVVQRSEASVGPYELVDFFLHRLVRLWEEPSRIRWFAAHAFAGRYDLPTLDHWLRAFLRRFAAAQFKRDAMPDGPKVGTVALSPRGDWRMPSDMRATAWLAELGPEPVTPGGAA